MAALAQTAMGILGGYDQVRRATLGLGLAAAGALPLAAGAEPLRFDTRAPLASSAGRVALPAPGDTITIQIHPPPGMDPQAIAPAVSAELDRRQRARAAGRQSALTDID